MTARIKYRAHNGYDTAEASHQAAAAATPNGPGESLTVQAHAEDADLNVMMRRMGVTGRMPEAPGIPTYGDFSEITDYRTALHAIQNANERFMEYPADLRARFDHDPQRFLEFCSNDSNRAEMHKLGLLKADAKLPTETAPRVPPEAPPAPAPTGKST